MKSNMTDEEVWCALSQGSPFLIAEVGQNHDGSLGQAHAFIDAIARSGAHAVKFQTHIAAAESTPDEPFRVNFSYVDATRYDYWKRMEFTQAQWQGLKDHATDRGLMFLSSAFSPEAVELLDSIDMPAWKIASGEIGSDQMLDLMANTGKPLIVSTGMSSYSDIGATLDRLRQRNARFVLLQCTSAYPCGPQTVGLNVLDEFRRRYACPVGLSDHSGTIFPAIAAATLGAQVIEVHATLSKDMFGPDISASLTIDELSQLAAGLADIGIMRESPVDKDAVAASLAPMSDLFSKSAVARQNIIVGERLDETNVAYRKPGTGIRERDFASYIGRTVTRHVSARTLFSDEDF
jgi:N,N'-diacetyllegionaminate synthase